MEKVLSNIVLLRPVTGASAAPEPLTPELVGEVANQLRRPQLQDGMQLGSLQPIKIVSVRDQLTVELQPERVAVQDESDYHPFSPRFWEVLTHINEALSWDFKPFGFNFKAAINHSGKPSGDVISRIFNAKELASRVSDRVEVQNAALRMPSATEEAVDYTWRIKIEPRFEDPENEATFFDANAHFETDFDPELARTSSDGIFESFSSFCTRIVDMGIQID